MSREMDIDFTKYDLHFTRNWFRSRNLSTFREFVQPEWVGKPITYLEIGVYEGQSLVWMNQHVLTHPGSRSVGIDTWLQTHKRNVEASFECKRTAVWNLRYWPSCQLHQITSSEMLAWALKKGFDGIARNTLDLCMIDGVHDSGAVCDDARRVLALMKSGGWMLFDDIENDRKKKHHVKQGLDLFLQEKGKEVELVAKHKYMAIYRKL